MKPIATFVLTLALASPVLSAECEPGEILVDSHGLSTEKLQLREALYRELCKRSSGDLIDGDDLTLKDRLAYSNKRTGPFTFEGSEILRKIKKLQNPVVLAYIVESSGRVSWVTFLEPSGDKEVDNLALSFMQQNGLGAPITIDGVPRRVFGTKAWFGKPKQ